jgi:undecaprenol kinase
MFEKIKTFFQAFCYAFNGIKETFIKERNFKFHLGMTFLVFLLGLFLNIKPIEWLILILTITAVLAAEIFNAAIESLCNLVKEENQLTYQRTKYIRDAAAGAVLVLAIGAVLIGLIIFFPYLK